MPAGLMPALTSLSTRLMSSFGIAHTEDSWSDDATTAKVLAQVRARHDHPGIEADPRTVASAIEYFCEHGRPDGWRGLKYACFGAGSPDADGWCLLSDKGLRDKLFDLARTQAEPRRQLKCFQSLLWCYWSFPFAKEEDGASADPAATEGWKALRTWLAARLPKLQSLPGRRPGWLEVLNEHANLLQSRPCHRYGTQLLEGDTSEFRAATEGLGIPSDSWVREAAVIAQMRAGAALEHDDFKDALPRLLSMAMGRADVKVSRALSVRCVAILVSRYARCPDRPERAALRDAAVSVIGNPWLYRSSWDAYVLNSRRLPDNDAREMVYGWLRRRLIGDFFELLSADGEADKRRLDYWLRYEGCMPEVWFALGSDARHRRGKEFEEFRKRAKGLLLNLERTTSDNNAFIMRIGEYVAIEFGATGNALYLFKWDELPAAVHRKLTSEDKNADVIINQLKSENHVMRKMHRDSPAILESWEQKFDSSIRELTGARADKRPAFVPVLESLLTQYSIDGEDTRPRGGALWAYADDSSRGLSTRLKGLGFNYRDGKGWWRE